MGNNYDSLDSRIAEHLRGLSVSTGIEDTETALELLATGWLEKEESFENQLTEKGMERIENFNPDDEDRGVIILTYSGSILTIGPVSGGYRSAAYASIGLRENVPDLAESEDAQIDGDIETGRMVRFRQGPVQNSSPVYRMGVFSVEMEPEDEEEALVGMTIALAEDFTEVNRTILS